MHFDVYCVGEEANNGIFMLKPYLEFVPPVLKHVAKNPQSLEFYLSEMSFIQSGSFSLVKKRSWERMCVTPTVYNALEIRNFVENRNRIVEVTTSGFWDAGVPQTSDFYAQFVDPNVVLNRVDFEYNKYVYNMDLEGQRKINKPKNPDSREEYDTDDIESVLIVKSMK